MTVTRGTSNTNVRGSAADRRARRAYLMATYASDAPGFVRCYRCGVLLYNPDDGENPLVYELINRDEIATRQLTIDRVIPGARGGTYRRSNIRPACGRCNSTTGALL